MGGGGSVYQIFGIAKILAPKMATDNMSQAFVGAAGLPLEETRSPLSPPRLAQTSGGTPP